MGDRNPTRDRLNFRQSRPKAASPHLTATILSNIRDDTAMRQRLVRFLMISLSLMALTVISANASPKPSGDRPSDTAVIAQRPRGTRNAWRRVYELMPELPLENQYVNLETGEPDADNTLISRLIRYHVFVRGRPFLYRLDWKLTLADYLGANELMSEGVYPSQDDLETNPMRGDREAIASLTRQQRDDLVHVLTSLFNPNYLSRLEQQGNTTTAVEPDSVESETGDRPRNLPRLPQSGDAELLLP